MRALSWIRLFGTVGLRNLRQRAFRSALTISGIAFGVAVYMAISMMNEATLRYFRENMESVAGNAKLMVSAEESGFDEKWLSRIEAVPGVADAVPTVEMQSASPAAQEALTVLGVDLLADKQVRRYRSVGKGVVGDALSFISQPDSIAVGESFAREHGLRYGSRLELDTPQGRKAFTVRGLLALEGSALPKAYGDGLIVMDIDAARLAFGRQGKVDRIDIVPAKGQEVVKLAHSLEELLGSGFSVQEPSVRSEQLERTIHSFRAMLTYIALLSLCVAGFFVFNTMGISISERRAEIGTFRALGASRDQVLALVIVESVAAGSLGALAGALFSKAAAGHLIGSVSGAMGSYAAGHLSASDLRFTPAHVIGAVAAGAFISALGAVFPGLRAIRIPPLEAIRRPEDREIAQTGPSRLARGAFATGLALLAYVVLAALTSHGAGSVAFQSSLQLFAVLGGALLAPRTAGLVILAASPLVGARKWIPFRLAWDNLRTQPKRTGANALTMMLGLTLVIIISSINYSFKETLLSWYQKFLYADLVASTRHTLVGLDAPPMDEAIREKLEKIPGVQGAYALRSTHLEYSGRTVTLKAFDELPPGPGRYRVFDVQDVDADRAGDQLFHSETPSILVSTSFNLHFGTATGGLIELRTARGLQAFRIAGTVTDFDSATGVIYFARPVYKKWFADPSVSAFGIKLAPGAEPGSVSGAISAAGGKLRLAVLSSGEIRRQLVDVIDRSFGYLGAIETVGLLCALLGLTNALLVGVLERYREIGTLRAIGMSRKQLIAMIGLEGAIQGALGASFALVLGVGLAALYVKQSLAYTLGWVVDFHFPWLPAFETLGIGICVAALAAAYPAYRAARAEIRDTLKVG